MASQQPQTYSISMQSAVYGTAFFNGTVQSMGSTIVALLVVALLDKNLALLIGIISLIFGVKVGASLQNPFTTIVLAVILVQMISGWCEATAWIGSQTLVGQLMKGHPVYAGRMTFVARIGGFLGPPAIGYAWDFWGAWGGFGFLAIWIVGGMIAA